MKLRPTPRGQTLLNTLKHTLHTILMLWVVVTIAAVFTQHPDDLFSLPAWLLISWPLSGVLLTAATHQNTHSRKQHQP